MVTIADIASGPRVERLIVACSDARLAAVMAMTASRIRQRGFAASPTVPESVGRAMTMAAETTIPDVTPDA